MSSNMWLEAIIFLTFLYLYCKLTCGISDSVTCLVGKTALVTGGNDGIGFQVCLNLASRGCRVIIADKDDSEKSRRQIIERTNNSNIISKKVDLTSFHSIRKFAKEINETEPKLDILINNAGAGSLPEAITEDGLNALVQVNYFGGFLLTHLMINLLKNSTSSRILFTTSSAAFISHLTPDFLLRKKFGGNAFYKTSIYGNSKLAINIVADIFAEKLKGTGITVNSVNPGWVLTKIWIKSKNSGDWTSWLGSQLLIIWGYVVGKDIWEGAQTTTHVATARDLDDVSGKLFWDCRIFAKPPQVKGDFWPLSLLGFKFKDKKDRFWEKIWRISEECCKLQQSEKI